MYLISVRYVASIFFCVLVKIIIYLGKSKRTIQLNRQVGKRCGNSCLRALFVVFVFYCCSYIEVASFLNKFSKRCMTGDSHNGDSDKLNVNLNLPFSDTNRQCTHTHIHQHTHADSETLFIVAGRKSGKRRVAKSDNEIEIETESETK